MKSDIKLNDCRPTGDALYPSRLVIERDGEAVVVFQDDRGVFYFETGYTVPRFLSDRIEDALVRKQADFELELRAKTFARLSRNAGGVK